MSSLAWCGGALLLIDPYYLRLLAPQVVCHVILFLKNGLYVKNTLEYAKSYVSKYVRKTVSWLHWSISQLYPEFASRLEGGMSNNKIKFKSAS